MRKLSLLIILAFAYFPLHRSQASEAFKRNHIGDFSVRSCDIFVPDMGISNESVLTVLREKGYSPKMANDMYLQGGGMKSVFGAAVKVMRPEYLANPDLNGLVYLDLTLTTNGLVNQTQLQLKIFGLSPQEPLFVSEGFDSELWPGHEDLFDADDLPSCN